MLDLYPLCMGLCVIGFLGAGPCSKRLALWSGTQRARRKELSPGHNLSATLLEFRKICYTMIRPPGGDYKVSIYTA